MSVTFIEYRKKYREKWLYNEEYLIVRQSNPFNDVVIHLNNTHALLAQRHTQTYR